MTHRVLIVEGETSTARQVQTSLFSRGYLVATEATGAGGLLRAEREPFGLVILDQKLPDISGFELCRRLRDQRKQLPIIMLTAHASEADWVRGLEAGVNDYVSKPLNTMELTARVKTTMRRFEQACGAGDDIIQLGDFRIDVGRHQVSVNGKRVELTAKEFCLLAFLARNPARVFSRVQLIDNIWGLAYDGSDHTVHSLVNRLRQKIETDPAHPKHICTVRNVGYQFRPHASIGQ